MHEIHKGEKIALHQCTSVDGAENGSLVIERTDRFGRIYIPEEDIPGMFAALYKHIEDVLIRTWEGTDKLKEFRDLMREARGE